MKSFDTELRKYTDKVRLTASERNTLRESLSTYMEYHPLPKHVAEDISSPFASSTDSFAVLRFSRRTAQLATGFFALTLIMLPFAAERSVPGEVLYLVKTGITEPVRAQFAASPYEKIEFETELVERRIAEARVLLSEGKLTHEVQDQLTRTVKEHTQNVTDQIAVLRTQDADGAAIAKIAFNSSLEVQTAVLHADGGEDVSSPIGTMLTTVTEARDAALKDAEETTPSYDALLARVEKEAARARELSQTINPTATTDEVQSIERRLSDIDRLILEVKTVRGTEDMNASTTVEIVATMSAASTTVDASEKLIATLRLTQKLIAFMTDINVRAAVPLEALVPVVLSEDERVAHVRDTLATIGERRTKIADTLPSVASSTVAADVSAGLSESDTLATRVQDALTAEDIAAAEEALTTLTTLVADLEILVNTPNETPVPPPTETPDEPETPVVSEESAPTSSETVGHEAEQPAPPPMSRMNASFRSMLRF